MRQLFHFIKYALKLEEPHTQVTERERELLKNYSRDAGVVVEIGCHEGKTSAALANNCAGQVYTVDHFHPGRAGVNFSEWIARLHRRRAAADNLEIIKGTSSNTASRFTQQIDFLFIDADHSYEAVKRDWELWGAKVPAGGIIALHDCKCADNSPNYLGSMAFYEQELCKSDAIEEIASVDSLVLFRVKGQL